MRYLLFFIVLFLHSHFVFSQGSGDSQPSSGGGSSGSPPEPTCSSTGVTQWVSPLGLSLTSNQCAASNGYQFVLGFSDPNSQVRCDHNCTCPAPTVFNVTVDANGVSSSGCIDPADEIPPDDSCDESDKVYDPVSGTLVCPGSGDGSGSSSSQTCVVPGDFNGDCVPDDQQNSSAATTSSTASSAASQSNSSTPSTGGGDDSGNPSTGGGNGGGGGNSGGSGSAAASSSGANSSWTPNSGYGNWIPVDANSNCPNKYKDSAGQWWCSGATNQASAGSASGACDPTATNYWSCINSGSAGSAGSSGSASSDDTEGKLTDKGDEIIEGFQEDIDSELDDFEKAYTDDIDEFVNNGVPFDSEPSVIKTALLSFLPVSSSCSPPVIKIMQQTYELDCEYFNLFKSLFGWFLAVLTIYNIWQLAIRPVER